MGTRSSSGPVRRQSSLTLPGWSIVLIGALVVISLAFAVVLQVEVDSLQSEESSPSSTQLESGTVNVTQDLVPGNASLGYWGSVYFFSPLSSGNPVLLEFGFLQTIGAPVTLEFDVCPVSTACTFPGGDLAIVPMTSGVSETEIVLEPAAGAYGLYLFNLPGYADGRAVVTFSVQVTIALLGHVDLH